MVTRAEHRRTTLLRLGEAAVRRFEQEGTAATIDAIATDAGLSRRTVFRYVASKEELAFVHPVLWLDVFEAGLKTAPAFPLEDRIRIASRAIAVHIDADPAPPMRAMAVVVRYPSLARGYTGVFQAWIDRVADEVLRSADDPDDPSIAFRSRVIGAAVMGMVDAVTRQWLAAGGDARFVDLYDEGFAVVAPLFRELLFREVTAQGVTAQGV